MDILYIYVILKIYNMKKTPLLKFLLFFCCLSLPGFAQTTQTITVPITVTTDDAFEYTNGVIDNTIGALYLGGSIGYKTSAFRFTNINLPNEAQVVSAYINFQTMEVWLQLT